MFQAAIHPLQELHQVKATAALLKVHTKKDLDYDAYSPLYYQQLLTMIVSTMLTKVIGKYMHMTL
jgi:diketogulonate reductase-like aldo/keto reductase